MFVAASRARATPADLHRALIVYAAACVLLGTALLALYLLLPGTPVYPTGPLVTI